MKPADLPGLEKKLRATKCDRALMTEVQALQLRFIKKLLDSPPDALYGVSPVATFPYAVTGERPDAAKARCEERGK